MGIDPNIIMGIKPVVLPQAQDPLDRANKELTYKSLVQQGQMQQQGMEDDTAQRQALIDSGGDNERYRALLAGRGQYKAVQAVDKAAFDLKAKQAEIDKHKADAAKSENEVAIKKLEHGAALLDGVNDQASYDMVKRVGAITGTFPKQMLDQLPEQYNPQIIAQLKQAGLTRAQQLTDQRAQETRDTTVSEGALNRANKLTIAGLGPDGKPLNAAPSGTVDLAKVSPVDLEAAYRYFADGTLPPNMGRGQQGMQESQRIRSIAAQISQNLGVSAEEARANQVLFKGSGQAVTALVKREAQVGANVRNFDFNADQVLQLSQKVDRTGAPVVNTWLNAGRRSVQGNADVSAFDVAVKTTVNEFAQIVSGTTAGATTEGEKQKAEALLNAAQTPEQIVKVINQMRVESQNRMKSFADQKQETLGRLRAGGPKPAAPGSATPTSAAPAAPMTATNPATGERIQSNDGGKTWQPMR